MDELEILRKKVNDLDEENMASYMQLQQDHGIPMDTTGARLAILIEHMAEIGLFTEEQALSFELKFHLKVQEALNHTWTEVRKMVAEQEAKAKKAKQKKLDVIERPSRLFGADGKIIK